VLTQLPSCSGLESLKRLKVSDCTVTGTATGAPLEELELLELDDELLLEELELPLEELLELLVDELAELVLLDALEELLDVLELLEFEELLVELELELLVEPELLEELDAAPEEELELDSSSPWVTNKPSPPQAVRAASTRLNVKERRDFVAELRVPDGNMNNAPQKCVIRVQVDIPRGTVMLDKVLQPPAARMQVRS
jgi:hypothetical protein